MLDFVQFHLIFCIQKTNYLFVCAFLARRARQFYRMRETTLCDICEGSDCSDTCQVRASQQRSPKSAFDDEGEEATVMQTDGSESIDSSILILVTSLMFQFLTM